MKEQVSFGEKNDLGGASCAQDGEEEVVCDEDMREFTHVISKKARRNARKKSATKNNTQGVSLSGTVSLGKGAKHHPLPAVVVGPRT